MGIADHYRSGMTERLLVRIITVDPAHSRVEVVGKDAAVIQIAVIQTSSFFVWPVQGDYWTVVRENGEWKLENKLMNPDQQVSASPGEGVVQADKIWTPSGDYLIRKSDLDAVETALETVEALIAPILTNSWVNFDVNRPARYYRDRNRVFLQGLIKSGTLGQSAFTLPAGYRPSGNRIIPTVSNDLFGFIVIDTNGLVVPTVGNNAYFSLDGMSFRHA